MRVDETPPQAIPNPNVQPSRVADLTKFPVTIAAISDPCPPESLGDLISSLL